MYVAIPVVENGSPVAVVRTSVPMWVLDKAVAGARGRFLLATLVAGLLTAGLTGGASLWISRAINRPLLEMTEGAQRYARGELGHRLPVSGPEETRRLAEAMNHMASELRQRIQAIQRQEKEHEAMLASMTEGVLAVDDHGVIISLNHACAALVGAEEHRLRGRMIHEVIREPELLKFVDSALSGPSKVEGDIQIRSTEDRWLHANGTVLHDADHQKIGALLVLHDNTRLHRLETMRRDFVANVSHELETPITSIKGFVETLLDGAINDRDNAHRFLEIVLRYINRLDSIIEDLLALSRVEKDADENTIHLEVGSVREVLQGAIQMCQRTAADKGVHVELNCPDDLATNMNAALLELAVVNLLDNAIKYSGANALVRVSAARADDRVTIRVEDQGCGIEARQLPRLFERFFRVDKARSRELGGTGLGLAIVKHIVLAHHGVVDVQSTVGKGSIFSIKLPADREHVAPVRVHTLPAQG